MEINIRRAKKDEAGILTDIAIKSEAYWGFDSEHMEKFRSLYKVTDIFIEKNPVFVIQENNNIAGFYGILIDKKKISLEYLFIGPESIGKGYGRLLWNHMVNICKELNMNEVDIVSNPEAKGFYKKMGAVAVGEIESLLKKGRMLPHLIYHVA